VYLSAADASGMMIPFIQSNNMGFGSGMVVPDTGISLQNRGCGFLLDPKHPNALAVSKRPFHTIIPGFAMNGNGKPLMSFGVMGGPMQAQGHSRWRCALCCTDTIRRRQSTPCANAIIKSW